MMELFDNRPSFLLPNKSGYRIDPVGPADACRIIIPNGELYYAEKFFDQKTSDRTVEYFLENDSSEQHNADWRSVEKEELNKVIFKNITWRHDKIRMYGREVYQPRYTAWYGDSGTDYSYSGLKMQPLPWNEGLAFIRDKVSAVAGIQFNSVLLNWYRDGDDHMGWHTDAEKELGINPIICSVNFGATRRFQFRRIDDHAEKFELALSHGTVLIMRGETQHFWQHAVPKQRAVKQSRFNLTFRVIKN